MIGRQNLQRFRDKFFTDRRDIVLFLALIGICSLLSFTFSSISSVNFEQESLLVTDTNDSAVVDVLPDEDLSDQASAGLPPYLPEVGLSALTLLVVVSCLIKPKDWSLLISQFRSRKNRKE